MYRPMDLMTSHGEEIFFEQSTERIRTKKPQIPDQVFEAFLINKFNMSDSSQLIQKTDMTP